MALTFYQRCFGGTLHFETFDKGLEGFKDLPIVSGSLVSDKITIHGSDLVHNEGRKVGNYISVFLQCEGVSDRIRLIAKLAPSTLLKKNDQKLIEFTDAFDVRWVLAV